MSDIYKPGLNYIKKAGLDLVLKEDEFGVKSVFTFKKHSYFGSKKVKLPRPFEEKHLNALISEEFMEHFDVITRVDIAIYVRIVSILLTNFTGPKDDDHIGFHVENLRKFLVKQKIDYENLIMDALIAYNIKFGKKKNFPKHDYISFARILNFFWNFYQPPRKQQPADPIDDFFDDYDDFDFYDDTPIEEDFDYSAHSNWIFKDPFKDFSDDKFLKMLTNETQLKLLKLGLKEIKMDKYTDDQLKKLDKKERENIIKKIKDWYAKLFPS